MDVLLFLRGQVHFACILAHGLASTDRFWWFLFFPLLLQVRFSFWPARECRRLTYFPLHNKKRVVAFDCLEVVDRLEVFIFAGLFSLYHEHVRLFSFLVFAFCKLVIWFPVFYDDFLLNVIYPLLLSIAALAETN